jgi:UDP-N-acetylglucosamine--N-acetylmuramyl-(pentapeptide) pyrophosphoryl-undecaprenol N-acetylglucosamine transferase
MKNFIHVVFAGGGTGGHLFPGLAVAQQLAAQIRGMRITFAGSGKDFERRHVTAAGFEYLALPCRPLPRGAREALSFVVENFAGYLAARRFLADEQVDTVVGLGGYASVPMGRAASRHRVPLVLLEQNALPGRANRWLARSASLVCTSFPQTEVLLAGRCAVRLTGNPVRRGASSQLANLRQANDGIGTPGKLKTCPTLLVLGGSGGARTLNENAPRTFHKVRNLLDGWQIIHQTGEAGLAATRELYRKFALAATVEPFLPDLPQLLTAADAVVCRAGGTTLAELAVAGVPAVLVPYSQAKDDHQRCNAEVFVAQGAATLVDEREITGRLDDRLAEVVATLVRDEGLRISMSAAMLDLARPHAAADVAGLVWSLASSRARRDGRSPRVIDAA